MASTGYSKRQPVDMAQRFMRVSVSLLLLAMLAMSVGITAVLTRDESEHEREDYRQVLTSLLNETLSPAVFDKLQAADEPQLHKIGARLADSTQAVQIKIMRPDGQVVWSDHPDLIGRTEPHTVEFNQAMGGTPMEHHGVPVALAGAGLALNQDRYVANHCSAM